MLGLTDWVRGMTALAREYYGVEPVLFLGIFLGSGPIFYYSLFRLVRSLTRRSGRETGIWSAVFLAATAAPYLYVLVCGRNLPVWVYGILVLLIGQGAWSLFRRLRRHEAEARDERKQS